MESVQTVRAVSKQLTHQCAVCSSTARPVFELRQFQYYRCTECGTVSTFPVPSSKEISHYYEEKFRRGNYQIARQLADYDRTCAQIAQALADYYGAGLKDRSVMDIGCFTGSLLYELQQKYNCQVMGVELQKEAVEIAKARLRGNVLQMDVDSSEFPDKKYDIVTLTGVIEHVIQPNRLLKRASELLNDDGVIMIQTPNAESMVAQVLRRYWPPLAPIEHIHIHSKRAVCMSLEKLGFEEIVVRRHWKNLSIEYVYSLMQTFGPELRKILTPLYKISPKNLRLPFYGGEIIVLARKKNRN